MNDLVWEAKRALKTARERMQGGDEWSAGYEVGRALELLERAEAEEEAEAVEEEEEVDAEVEDEDD